MKTVAHLLILGAALGMCGCSSDPYVQRGTAAGAVGGAVLGGIIGHQSGEAAEGAMLGAAAGGLVGNVIASEQQRTGDRPPVTHADTTSRTFTSGDYIAMMTPEEIKILQQRAEASGRRHYELTDFLTDQEKANLRQRWARQSEIGR